MKINPEFIIYTGPMWGSKTSRLISSIERLKYQGQNVVVYKPSMDSRYSQSHICTHAGAKWPAHCISSGAALLTHYKALRDEFTIVAIDEAFMIDGVASAALEIFRNGTTVLIASLDLSAKGRSFDEIRDLLPFATRIEKCPAVCPICGDDAFYTAKLINDNQEIQIGSTEMYEPRCFRHHPVMCNLNERVV